MLNLLAIIGMDDDPEFAFRTRRHRCSGWHSRVWSESLLQAQVKHNTCGKARCTQLALTGVYNAWNDSGSEWIAAKTPDCCAQLRQEYKYGFSLQAQLSLRSFLQLHAGQNIKGLCSAFQTLSFFLFPFWILQRFFGCEKCQSEFISHWRGESCNLLLLKSHAAS